MKLSKKKKKCQKLSVIQWGDLLCRSCGYLCDQWSYNAIAVIRTKMQPKQQIKPNAGKKYANRQTAIQFMHFYIFTTSPDLTNMVRNGLELYAQNKKTEKLLNAFYSFFRLFEN